MVGRQPPFLDASAAGLKRPSSEPVCLQVEWMTTVPEFKCDPDKPFASIIVPTSDTVRCGQVWGGWQNVVIGLRERGQTRCDPGKTVCVRHRAHVRDRQVWTSAGRGEKRGDGFA